MMVKNEDLFIGKVIRAIQYFVDDIVFIDTGSNDGTVDEAKRFGINPIIEKDLLRTHRFVEPYVSEDVWIFGVDGDELYDPSGLVRMKEALKRGLYDGAYQVQGWYLHAVDICRDEATGYLGPPSHTPTKLYNMKNILRWPSDGKRTLFHPKTREVRGTKMRAEPDTWGGSPLRCIHTRFLRRSSREDGQQEGARLHPEDITGHGSRSDRGGGDLRNERLIYRKGGEKVVGIWPLG
jgi:glycosyltransferase involved in cell wall biosynthesis